MTAASIFPVRVGQTLVRSGGDGDSDSDGEGEEYDDPAVADHRHPGLACLVASQLSVGVALVATFAAFVSENSFWADVQAPNLSGALVNNKYKN